MKRKHVFALLILASLLMYLLWSRHASPSARASVAAPAPPPAAVVSSAPGPVIKQAAFRRAAVSSAATESAPAAKPDTIKNALFGPLVALGQSYSLVEALEKNAANADAYVDKLCSESAKLRDHPPMPAPTGNDHDAAEFMAPLIDYEKPLDQPPGALHLTDELRAHLAAGYPDWSQRISDGDLAGLDFGWMKQLSAYDHWSLLAAGRLKDFAPTDFFTTPIPNYVSLMQWAKLRFALARRRGDHANASVEVRHLADLIRSQNLLISEAVAVAMYKIDGSARGGAVAAGGDVSGWPTVDTVGLDTDRSEAFAAMYFTYPGVKPETLRKAVACMPAPCAALGEGAGANRAFGAYSSDNLQLVLELAKSHGCEQALFDRAVASREVSAQEAWEQAGDTLDGQIPKYLGQP